MAQVGRGCNTTRWQGALGKGNNRVNSVAAFSGGQTPDLGRHLAHLLQAASPEALGLRPWRTSYISPCRWRPGTAGTRAAPGSLCCSRPLNSISSDARVPAGALRRSGAKLLPSA